MYTLNTPTSRICVKHNTVDYVLAFKSVMLARKVHYQLAQFNDCTKMTLLPSVDKQTHWISTSTKQQVVTKLNTDMVATLFVPKTTTKEYDPIMDGGIHLDTMLEQDLYALPQNGLNGIVLPMKVLDETHDEMVLRCMTFDPIIADDYDNIRLSLKSLFD
jgi:hypothetical protein